MFTWGLIHMTHRAQWESLVFDPEVEYGNVEYKLKLSENLSEERFQQLASQMKWRCSETGDAYYYIGVSDDGKAVGISPRDLGVTLKSIKNVASYAGCVVSDVSTKKVGSNLVARVHCQSDLLKSFNVPHKNIIFLGESGVGKSTILGVLTEQDLDDGRGSCRLNILTHRHELIDGKTSSLAHESIYFDSYGETLSSKHSLAQNKQLWPDFEKFKKAKSYVNFIDTPGMDTFQHTTLSGLSMIPFDAICVVIDVSRSKQMENSLFLLQVALSMQKIVIIILNKIDLAFNITVLRQRISDVVKHARRQPSKPDYESLSTVQKVPIIEISCLSGSGIRNFENFLFKFSKSVPQIGDVEGRVNFSVCKVQSIKDFGDIALGYLPSGSARVDGNYYIGPNASGTFVPCKIRSIHRHQTPIDRAVVGERVALSITCEEMLEKGMCLVADQDRVIILNSFTVKMKFLSVDSANQSATLYLFGKAFQCTLTVLDRMDSYTTCVLVQLNHAIYSPTPNLMIFWSNNNLGIGYL